MSFSDWREALPFALKIGRAKARRCPLPIDVDSVVMEALWKAQTAGVVFSKAYVYLRTTGAIRDEMRRVAEGQRGNYQSARLFVDVHEHGRWIAGEETDLDALIDRQRLLESMPEAARELVTRLAQGEAQKEMAATFGVSAGRVSQVTCLLKTKPHAVQRLPGQVALFEQIRRAHRSMVQRAYARTGTVTGVASELGVSVSDASRWVNSRALILPSKWRHFPELRERARSLVKAAFVRANGSPMMASRLLMADQPVTGVLGRELAPEVFRSNRRPDLSVEAIVRMRKSRMSMAAIAEHYGVSEHTVQNRCRAAAEPVPTLCKVRPDLPDSAFAELRAQGLKYREIAERLGVSMPTVYQRLARARRNGAAVVTRRNRETTPC